jgi:hypothetical protein
MAARSITVAAAAVALVALAATRALAASGVIPVNIQTFSNLACYGGNGAEHVLTCWRTATGFAVELPASGAAKRPFVDKSVRGHKVLPIPGVGVTLLYRKTWRSPNGDFRCASSNELFNAHLVCRNRTGKGFDLGSATYAVR